MELAPTLPKKIMPKLITVREARKLLHKYSDGAVYDLVRQGAIPAGPLVRLGRRIYFNEDLLREFVERGGNAAPQPNSQNKKAQKQSDDSAAAA